jgi:hypothetical protein
MPTLKLKPMQNVIAACALLYMSATSASAQDTTSFDQATERFNIEITGPYEPAASDLLTAKSGNNASASTFRCGGQKGSLGGFGDTFRRSDTRSCGGSRKDFYPRGGFVPGLVNRTYVASFTPCVAGRGTLFTPEGELVARGVSRGGCPNGRATVDFCLPGGGGAVAMARKHGEKGILQWETPNGVECFNVLFRCTIRNGRLVPNRPGVQERGEPSLGGVCR